MVKLETGEQLHRANNKPGAKENISFYQLYQASYEWDIKQKTDFSSKQKTDSIANSFFTDFDRKDFKNIYSNSSITIKEKLSLEQFESTLSVAHSYKENQEYKIYNYSHLLDSKYGSIVSINYKAETKERTLLLNLNFIKDKTRFILAGFQIK